MKKIGVLFLIMSVVLIGHAQERYILTSDSVKLYIKVEGKGIPCLYIHGGPAAGSYFLEKLVGDFQKIFFGDGRFMP